MEMMDHLMAKRSNQNNKDSQMGQVISKNIFFELIIA